MASLEDGVKSMGVNAAEDSEASTGGALLGSFPKSSSDASSDTADSGVSVAHGPGGGDADASHASAAAARPKRPKRYRTSPGYVTDRFRKEFSKKHKIADAQAKSLDAPVDASEHIYFWQLYSVLGPDRIEEIVKAFYERVWGDEEDWFRTAFTDVTDIGSAVWAQTMMWLDVMGGGRRYHGGDYRLSFHHSRVAQVMTRRGAVRWLEHMYAVLNEPTVDLGDHPDDIPRVRVALDEFFQYFMGKYAGEFRFDDQGLKYAPVSDADTNGASRPGSTKSAKGKKGGAGRKGGR